jgi:hypothetical protein
MGAKAVMFVAPVIFGLDLSNLPKARVCARLWALHACRTQGFLNFAAIFLSAICS